MPHQQISFGSWTSSFSTTLLHSTAQSNMHIGSSELDFRNNHRFKMEQSHYMCKNLDPQGSALPVELELARPEQRADTTSWKYNRA